MGAQTAVGYSAMTSAASIRSGISRLGKHPFMVDKKGHPVIMARAVYLDDGIPLLDRFLQLGIEAAKEALNSLDTMKFTPEEIPLILGLPGQRPGFDKEMVDEIKGKFQKTKFPCTLSPVETITCGHSAGLMAVARGCDYIKAGVTDICLVGGIDSYEDPDTREWLDETEQLHSKTTKYGFVPGEGAGFCLLATPKIIKKKGTHILGNIIGAAITSEKNIINTNTTCTGEGLSNAIWQAIVQTDNIDLIVDHIICDMNGVRYRGDEYGFTVPRLRKYLKAPDEFLTPADKWGDVGAASGPLFLNLAISSNLRYYAKGPVTLAWTSSDGGERSAVLMEFDNYNTDT